MLYIAAHANDVRRFAASKVADHASVVLVSSVSSLAAMLGY
jgi:hypothetical protein